MLRRFASGAVVASVLVTCAALIINFLPDTIREQAFPVLLAWVCLPAIWGTWAMLTPESWMPERLPAWGSFLGVLAGVGAMFVVDAPKRLIGLEANWVQRVAAVLMFVVLYYAFWTVVRAVYRSLTAPESLSSQQHAGRV